MRPAPILCDYWELELTTCFCSFASAVLPLSDNTTCDATNGSTAKPKRSTVHGSSLSRRLGTRSPKLTLVRPRNLQRQRLHSRRRARPTPSARNLHRQHGASQPLTTLSLPLFLDGSLPYTLTLSTFYASHVLFSQNSDSLFSFYRRAFATPHARLSSQTSPTSPRHLPHFALFCFPIPV